MQGIISSTLEKLSHESSVNQATPPCQLEEVKRILEMMEEPSTVAWAPKFGSALVAVVETDCIAQSTIHAVCLDGWLSHAHRCENAGQLTHVRDVCSDPVTLMLPVCLPVCLLFRCKKVH